MPSPSHINLLLDPVFTTKSTKRRSSSKKNKNVLRRGLLRRGSLDALTIEETEPVISLRRETIGSTRGLGISSSNFKTNYRVDKKLSLAMDGLFIEDNYGINMHTEISL